MGMFGCIDGFGVSIGSGLSMGSSAGCLMVVKSLEVRSVEIEDEFLLMLLMCYTMLANLRW